MRRLIVAALCVWAAACGGGNGSPTAPSQPVQTKSLRLEAILEFGDVSVGGSAERELRIINTGSAPVTVTGLTGPAGFTASWTNGIIGPGATQLVVIRFSPTEGRDYTGTVTVNGDQLGGPTTTPISGRGSRPLFTRSGSRNSVFNLPADVSRVRIFGRWDGRGTSNFVVRVSGRLVVNAILRDTNPYDGVHLVTGGGVVEVVGSENIVEWRFTEER